MCVSTVCLLCSMFVLEYKGCMYAIRQFVLFFTACLPTFTLSATLSHVPVTQLYSSPVDFTWACWSSLRTNPSAVVQSWCRCLRTHSLAPQSAQTDVATSGAKIRESSVQRWEGFEGRTVESTKVEAKTNPPFISSHQTLLVFSWSERWLQRRSWWNLIYERRVGPTGLHSAEQTLASAHIYKCPGSSKRRVCP
jgi:hypothetical protein